MKVYLACCYNADDVLSYFQNVDQNRLRAFQQIGFKCQKRKGSEGEDISVPLPQEIIPYLLKESVILDKFPNAPRGIPNQIFRDSPHIGNVTRQ